MLQKWKLDEEPELVVRSAEEERAVPRYKRKHGKQARSRPPTTSECVCRCLTYFLPDRGLKPSIRLTRS